MDAFELARKKHQKNLERRERVAAKKEETVSVAPDIKPQVPALLVPKEKSQDAFIEVKVTLPHKEFVVTLRKRNVLSNMNPSKATPENFSNAIRAGLIPLLGAVE